MNRFAQTSPKYAGVFIEKVFSVEAGPLGPTDGRKFQYLPLRLLSLYSKEECKKEFRCLFSNFFQRFNTSVKDIT